MSASRHTQSVFVVVVTELDITLPPISRHFATARAAKAWAARWSSGAYRTTMARYERAPWPRSRSQKRGR